MTFSLSSVVMKESGPTTTQPARTQNVRCKGIAHAFGSTSVCTLTGRAQEASRATLGKATHLVQQRGRWRKLVHGLGHEVADHDEVGAAHAKALDRHRHVDQQVPALPASGPSDQLTRAQDGPERAAERRVAGRTGSANFATL